LTPIFSKPLRQIFPKSLFNTTGYLKCVNLYFGPDLTTGSPGKLPTIFEGLRVYLLPLRHRNGHRQKYSKSEGRFCQLRGHIARIPLVRISRTPVWLSNALKKIQTSASPSARGDGPTPRCRAAWTVWAPIRRPETLLPVHYEVYLVSLRNCALELLPLRHRNGLHHGRQGGQTGRNTAKTIVHGAVAAKPKVEIWRRPIFSTQRPRLPIRSPIHYGVYLAPLRSCQLELLPLRHYNGRRTWRKYCKSEGRFCQLRAHIARTPVVRISRNSQGR